MNNRKVYLVLIFFIFATTYAGIAMIQHAEKAEKTVQEIHKEEINKKPSDNQGDILSDEDEQKEEDFYEANIGNSIYEFTGSFDPDSQKINGTLLVTATNDTGIDQESIFFHLYSKIYENVSKYDQEWNFIFGKNRTKGKMDIHHVSVNGHEATSNINGTIMEIPLEEWKQNEDVKIEMSFTIEVPKNSGVFSYDSQSTWFGSWLPIRAVYNTDGWYLNPYHPIGDPLYSDIASYNVKISIPANYHITTSGNEYNADVIATEGSEKDVTTYKIFASNVRDFAMVIMDDTYDVLRSEVMDVKINVWYRNQSKEAMQKYLEATEKSISYFSERYGMYPYQEFDVVATGGFFGGMEYPGLVFIQSSAFEKELTYGYTVIAHEAAHQWWYALVGNNAIEEPWLDESLTNYSTLRFLLDEYNSVGNKTLQTQKKYLQQKIAEYKEEEQFIQLPAKDFDSWETYILSIYYFGSQMFYNLEQMIGQEKMNEALHLYVERFSYKNASKDDFINVFAEVIGPEVRSYFDSWLENEMIDTLAP